MDSSARSQLNSIKSDLRSVINQLENIADSLRDTGNYQNIGADICANKLDEAATKYRNVLNKLNNLDTTTVTKPYAEAHADD